MIDCMLLSTGMRDASCCFSQRFDHIKHEIIEGDTMLHAVLLGHKCMVLDTYVFMKGGGFWCYICCLQHDTAGM